MSFFKIFVFTASLFSFSVGALATADNPFAQFKGMYKIEKTTCKLNEVVQPPSWDDATGIKIYKVAGKYFLDWIYPSGTHLIGLNDGDIDLSGGTVKVEGDKDYAIRVSHYKPSSPALNEVDSTMIMFKTLNGRHALMNDRHEKQANGIEKQLICEYVLRHYHPIFTEQDVRPQTCTCPCHDEE